MQKELDLISIIDSSRKACILATWLMDRNQKFLAENQPIDLADEDDNFLDYPKTTKHNINIQEIRMFIDQFEDSTSFNLENKVTQKLISKILGKDLEEINHFKSEISVGILQSKVSLPPIHKSGIYDKS